MLNSIIYLSNCIDLSDILHFIVEIGLLSIIILQYFKNNIYEIKYKAKYNKEFLNKKINKD